MKRTLCLLGALTLSLGLFGCEKIRARNEIKAANDAYEHEAWNRTAEVRVVLFVDFVKPLRFPASLVNSLLLNLAVFTPFIREGYDNQRRWERRFYGQAEAE